MYIKYHQRLFILELLITFAFISILYQLINIQIVKSDGIVAQAKRQFYRKPIVLRGDIRDRNGNLLVLDIINYDLYNNVQELKKIPNERIQKLSEILKIPKDTLLKKLSQKRNTKILANIKEDTVKKIQEEKINFIFADPKITRSYPHKKLASHIIGFVNYDHNGQHGVEYFNNGILTTIPESSSKKPVFLKGTGIVLTIDSLLQEYAESELNKAMNKSRAERGTIIVMSPKTGEILAWAVSPGFDPNTFYKERILKNWSITDIYQPGSTFKILTISAALENSAIERNDSFYDTGSLKVGKRIIKNHGKTKPQYINLLELFKQSSNVAAAQVGLKMEPEIFYNTLKKFRIGQKTNIDLPGESNGLLLDNKKWRTIDSATTAFGQGAVSLTPLQLASAISAIANHGMWMQPYILKGIWDPNYNLIAKSPYEKFSEQVISPETADYVSELLKQSVDENVKAMAYIGGNVPGYKVAGKTGTAQKVRTDGKGYLGGHTVASFIGYLPAEDPSILTIVVIDDPKTEGGWGNTICGPVFNNVAKMAAKRFIESPLKTYQKA